MSTQPTITDAPSAQTRYCGVPATAVYTNVREEFAALASGCGLTDATWRTGWTVTGEDRSRWLNGMLTNNVRDLAEGHGVYGFFLDPKGHVQGDAHCWNLGDRCLLMTNAAQKEKLFAFLDHYIIMDDVTLTDAEGMWTSLIVTGPKALTVLAMLGLPAAALEPLSGERAEWNGAPLLVTRTDARIGTQFEIWLQPDQKTAFWQAMMEQSATPVGSEAYEMWRIANGIPLYGADIRERDLPQEINQDQRALHFTKGCYIGQEIVERIRSRGQVHREFTGFTVAGELPAPGTPSATISLEGRDIGEITSVAALPLADGDRTVALGYLRRKSAASGTTFEITGATLTVAPPPFEVT